MAQQRPNGGLGAWLSLCTAPGAMLQSTRYLFIKMRPAQWGAGSFYFSQWPPRRPDAGAGSTWMPGKKKSRPPRPAKVNGYIILPRPYYTPDRAKAPTSGGRFIAAPRYAIFVSVASVTLICNAQNYDRLLSKSSLKF